MDFTIKDIAKHAEVSTEFVSRALNDSGYLAFDGVLACGGSWMVKDNFIKSGNFAEITRLTMEAVNGMLGFDLAHIGINAFDADTSLQATKRFCTTFNLPLKEGASSNFAGSIIEVNKVQGLVIMVI